MADEMIDATQDGESRETGSAPTAEQIMQAMFHDPLGATPVEEGAPIVATEQETAPPAEAGTLDFGKVIVDGQELDFSNLPKEKALELLRKGATFDQRLSRLDMERAEVEKARKDIWNPDTQAMVHEVRVLQELRQNNPEGYRRLVDEVRKSQATPGAQAPAADSRLAALDKIAEQHKDYPLVGQLAETIKELHREITTLKAGVAGELDNTKKTVAQIAQEREQMRAAEAKRAMLSEIESTRKMLLEKGVSEDEIKAKAKDFSDFYMASGGKIPFRKLAEIFFPNITAAAAQAVRRQPDPMRSGSTPASGPARSNASDIDTIQMALFGRKIKS